MGYLDKTTITVDAILTKKGRELLARNDGSFNITQFALGDDEIDYSLFNENHPNGSQYSGEAIENMPLIEAIPDETNILRSKLVTLDRSTTVIPFIDLGVSNITLAVGVGQSYSPSTVNFTGTGTNNKESSYKFTIGDRRLVSSFTTSGGNQNQVSTSPYSGTAVSETIIGQNVSITAINQTALFGTNNRLATTLTVEGVDTGARLSVPLIITKTNQGTTTTTSTTEQNTY